MRKTEHFSLVHYCLSLGSVLKAYLNIMNNIFILNILFIKIYIYIYLYKNCKNATCTLMHSDWNQFIEMKRFTKMNLPL